MVQRREASEQSFSMVCAAGFCHEFLFWLPSVIDRYPKHNRKIPLSPKLPSTILFITAPESKLNTRHSDCTLILFPLCTSRSVCLRLYRPSMAGSLKQLSPTPTRITSYFADLLINHTPDFSFSVK